MSREIMAFRWSNGGFFPAQRFIAQAAEAFVDGATYWLSAEAERTEKSHRHEFAWIKEAWKTLPDSIAQEYPSSEHLRKRALIDAGYYAEQIIDGGSHAAALRVCQGMRAREGETFTLIFVRGPFVIVRTAESQSHRAMGAKRFQESKTAIMERVADLLGVTPEQITRARAA